MVPKVVYPDTADPDDLAGIAPCMGEVLAAQWQPGLARENGGVRRSGHIGGQMIDQRFKEAGRQGLGAVASF